MGVWDSPNAGRQGYDEAQYATGKLDKDEGMSSGSEDERSYRDSRLARARGTGRDVPHPARTLPTPWM